MPERVATIFVFTTLRGSEYETAVFDRAGAYEHVPVRLARLFGKRRWNSQHRGAGFGQGSIEGRETQIVTDRQSQPAPRQIRQHRQFTRPVIVRFAIAFTAREVDIEHVNLVVARDDLTFRVDQE